MLEATQTAKGESVFTSSREWQGQVVNGAYPLRQYVGGSEHSAVFLTEIPGQNSQRAALKLIAPTGDTDVQLGRFRLAAEIAHPHLLRIFKVGRTHIAGEDLLFLVTEYADETLSQILPQRTLTPAEVTDMVKPCMETLAYLHQNGFAHGRLKPTNIMVVGEQLKLSSDGLCRAGVLPASIEPDPYDPPELSTKGSSPAGDVWSLGVILAEALTQRFPKWTDRLQKEPVLPENMAEPFAEIARHCLVRDPQSRGKIAEITNRLFPPARTAHPKGGSLQTKLKSALNLLHFDDLKIRPVHDLKIRHILDSTIRDIKDWISRLRVADTSIYAVPIAAMMVIILLLAALRHHGPSSPPKTAATASSPAQTLRPKPSQSATRTKLGPMTEPGQIVQQVVPSPPEKALRTITGKIRVDVRVFVDADGSVQRAQLATAGPSKYFANLALQCAREWRFTPATQGVSPAWMLRFSFAKSGATVQPRQIVSSS